MIWSLITAKLYFRYSSKSVWTSCFYCISTSSDKKFFPSRTTMPNIFRANTFEFSWFFSSSRLNVYRWILKSNVQFPLIKKRIYTFGRVIFTDNSKILAVSQDFDGLKFSFGKKSRLSQLISRYKSKLGLSSTNILLKKRYVKLSILSSKMSDLNFLNLRISIESWLLFDKLVLYLALQLYFLYPCVSSHMTQKMLSLSNF